MERKNAKIRCDETMILCDCTPQRNKFITDLFPVCYLYSGDDEGKKIKTLYLAEITRLSVRKLI